MTNFGFLQSEWPQLFADVEKAEALVIPDPRTACSYRSTPTARARAKIDRKKSQSIRFAPEAVEQLKFVLKSYFSGS